MTYRSRAAVAAEVHRRQERLDAVHAMADDLQAARVRRYARALMDDIRATIAPPRRAPYKGRTARF